MLFCLMLLLYDMSIYYLLLANIAKIDIIAHPLLICLRCNIAPFSAVCLWNTGYHFSFISKILLHNWSLIQFPSAIFTWEFNENSTAFNTYIRQMRFYVLLFISFFNLQLVVLQSRALSIVLANYLWYDLRWRGWASSDIAPPPTTDLVSVSDSVQWLQECSWFPKCLMQNSQLVVLQSCGHLGRLGPLSVMRSGMSTTTN